MSLGGSANTTFLGLATTTAIFAAIGGVCLVGFETLRQLKRLPTTHFRSFDLPNLSKKHRKTDDDGVLKPDAESTKLTCEDWEMGHLYHARTFHATTPTPPLAKWPLQWAWQALKFNDWFYATHTGMDTVIYVRYLKVAVLWTLLHTLTTAPTLLAVHFHYSETFVKNDDIDESNMARASISYVATSPSPQCASSNKTVLKECVLSPNPTGQKILWVHLLLLYYMVITWFYALYRVANGGLKIRWRLIQRIRETEAKRAEENELTEEMIEHRGWRQRTLMISNMPATMRDEAGIRRYFEEYLRPDDASTIAGEHESMLHEGTVSAAADTAQKSRPFHERGDNQPFNTLKSSDSRRTADQMVSPVDTAVDEQEVRRSEPKMREPKGPEPDMQPDRHLQSPVQAVVLVRKMNELSALLARRQAVLSQLEAAHVKLATNVLTAVEAQIASSRPTATEVVKEQKPKSSLRKHLESMKKRKKGHRREQNSSDLESHDGFQLSERNLRMDALIEQLGPYVHRQNSQKVTGTLGKDDMIIDDSVWEALSQVPRELLDQYQPVTRLSALFRGQTVPTIDYLLTKLNLLTALVTEMRAKPPSSYASASTAFVTFRDPRQARMVWRELKDQIVVKVRLAPEVKDLDWERLMSTTFSGEVVRGAGVSVGVWAATLFWTITIGFLTSALSNISNIGALKPFFQNHLRLQGFVATTLPSLAVILITMSVPELVFQVSKRAQGFVTFSQLYDMCLTRYWKFVILNVVIFFAIGSSALQTIFFAKTGAGSAKQSKNILATIAYSFPSSASYFVSYLILGMGLHTGYELVGFMVPLIQHYGARRASTPRVRAIKTLPRNFNRYYWLPFHILIMTILFIFTLLNPLVMPFGLVYLGFALIVFKKNLAFIYYRRFNEMEGVIYFVRMLRFSLDGLIVGETVLLIFFAVAKARAVFIAFAALAIPITVLYKLIMTRWWRSQCRALDEEEACALCGLQTLKSLAESGHTQDCSYVSDPFYRGSLDAHAPEDARATGRFPTIIAPPQTSSVFYNTWQKIHDSFHANGYDRPSHIAQLEARGQKLDNPALAGAKALVHAPGAAARMTGQAARTRASIAKVTLGLGRGHEQKSMQDAIQQVNERIGADVSNANTTTVIPELSGLEEEEEGNRLKSKRSRGGSSFRSENAPFLSGFDALNSHAPVVSKDTEGDEDEDDGLLRVHSTPRRSRSDGNSPSKKARANLPRIDTSDHAVQKSGPETQPNASGRDEAQDVSEFGKVSTTVAALGDNQTQAAADKGPLSEQDKSSRDEQSDWNEDLDDEEEDDEEDWPLVRKHAPVSWDDTPSNTAKYTNPFYHHHLDPFLWLPRDPLAPLNLFDTIEWYGPALVSSQGGAGNVGEWDDEEDEEDENEKLSDSEKDAFGGLISGNEEIILNDSLARHLEEAEEVEEAIDPADSIPKAVMNDYRDAIRKNSRSEGGESIMDSPTSPRLHRQDSYASAFSNTMSSIRSPTRTVRMRADQSQSIPTMTSDGRPRALSGATDTQLGEEGDLTTETVGPSGSTSVPTVQITDATLTGEPDATITSTSPIATSGLVTSPETTMAPQRIGDGGVAMTTAPTGHSIAFAGSTKNHDHDAHMRIASHSRRSAAASNISHASSSGTRPVTLQQALRAEILEEEWRTTLKERLVTLRRSKMVSKFGGKKRRKSEKTVEEEEAKAASSILPEAERQQVPPSIETTGIMARHAQRRQQARSEAGEQTVEELMHAARAQGFGAGHQRGFSLGRSRSRARTTNAREASTSSAHQRMPVSGTAATWNPISRANDRQSVEVSASAPAIENVPMQEFGARPRATGSAPVPGEASRSQAGDPANKNA
ncbi:hypothetical protein OC846_004765 [Tilletia horrida]|uniref:CSC1/OSCA1-like 7TM region domain-containing protein n=1 Tax=Tilletia horrida TaxID=155126 RepID=A0AAN6GLQ4_9BASI|nr:hypothetical protein OC846_004765 [Tilletia horrida]